MSTDTIYQSVLRAVKTRTQNRHEKLCILDIGAGQGQLLRLLLGHLDAEASACDYHTERFELANVPIAKINLNHDALPYADGTFDLITCSEVVEHVENYHDLLRKARRVLKPGGLLVLTTPNVLNMKSRLRYFASGFANLFGPLPVKNDKLYETSGHITPIPYFYLARSMLDAGFGEIKLDIDKTQKTSLVLYLLLYPLWLTVWFVFLSAERNRYQTLTPENEDYVRQHGAFSAMTGRTIVVSAIKK